MDGVLVETDLITEFLLAESDASLLRRLLAVTPCYCTFIQAAEVYSATRSAEEARTVDRALFGLKILGASSRYAKTIGSALSSSDAVGGHRGAIVAAMALESRLPVVTDAHVGSYPAIPGLVVLEAHQLRSAPDVESLVDMLMKQR